jgi:5-methyltetrahydrofolate--homocysteine methyltransferase
MAMLDQNARACEGIYLMLSRDPVRPILLDGAIGTELIARGMRLREECPESWNLERPQEVRAIHAAYAAAGSEVVQTNTFGATRPRLARFGRADRQREIIAAAVALARHAGVAVWGSLGPTGATVPLAGNPDVGWIEAAYAEAAAALAECGVDAIHLETQFHPAELEAAIRGARSAGKPVIASMTLIAGVSGLETPHGVPITKMIRAVEAGEPNAVGVNCSVDAERMRRAVETLREALPLPVVAKPQAKISDKCATGRSSESPETFARFATALVDAGACAVGGCCGIGPDGIAALRRALDARAAKVAS